VKEWVRSSRDFVDLDSVSEENARGFEGVVITYDRFGKHRDEHPAIRRREGMAFGDRLADDDWWL